MIKIAITLLSFTLSIFTYGQPPSEEIKIELTGKLIDNDFSTPLEYASITAINPITNKPVYGTMTNEKGDFKLNLKSGIYLIKYEYMGYNTWLSPSKNYTETSSLGTIRLTANAKSLNEVVIRAEKSSASIKLDKKVFSIGKDLLVRGGTVSDVLDNVPSITVNSEGTVALRGNENVRILIDGKPANTNNVSETLKILNADAVDKIEIITNPSARYDAEGGGGIINIILKKGKNTGLNGALIATLGTPENSSLSASINQKKELFNLFSTIGYNKRKILGNALINQENLTPIKQVATYLEERRANNKKTEGLNINFGLELLIDKKTSWTNALNYRNNTGSNYDQVDYHFYNPNKTFTNTNERLNEGTNLNYNAEYTTNFIKKFKKEGHQITFDGAFGKEADNEESAIYGTNKTTYQILSNEKINKKNIQTRNLVQVDYNLPLSKETTIEAGFRGNYLKSTQDFQVQSLNLNTNTYFDIPKFTNQFNYTENVNAVYLQYGSKIKKFSYLMGYRLEHTHVVINWSANNENKTKNYTQSFPSLFLTYQIQERNSISLNYSKRITRPRDRFINPFNSYTSNLNYLQGNPDINPAYTHALDLAYLKQWNQLMLNASVYYNNTYNAFQLIRKETGEFIDKTPVITNTFFNLGTENKTGIEATLNYNPEKWISLNANINYFNILTTGEFSYINFKNETIYKNFDYKTQSWTSRLTSKITLPYKIAWQTNTSYTASQKNAQGTTKGYITTNTGLSKEILKEKATIAFNITDLFNSKKRIQNLALPTVNSYSEMQNRTRQITLSFTYRFNKKNNEKDYSKPKNHQNENDEMIGG